MEERRGAWVHPACCHPVKEEEEVTLEKAIPSRPAEVAPLSRDLQASTRHHLSTLIIFTKGVIALVVAKGVVVVAAVFEHCSLP